MSTPFDDITWRLRFTGIDRPPIRPLPIATPAGAVQENIQVNNVLAHDPNPVPHTPEQRAPLRNHSKFQIKIAENMSVEILFEDPTPLNMQTIWARAENVYYDEEFYAVRGDLMYDTNTGLKSHSFGKHFIISYDGRMGTSGSGRQLSVELYNEADVATPTFDLNHRRFFISTSHGGSWKADD